MAEIEICDNWPMGLAIGAAWAMIKGGPSRCDCKDCLIAYTFLHQLKLL